VDRVKSEAIVLLNVSATEIWGFKTILLLFLFLIHLSIYEDPYVPIAQIDIRT